MAMGWCGMAFSMMHVHMTNNITQFGNIIVLMKLVKFIQLGINVGNDWNFGNKLCIVSITVAPSHETALFRGTPCLAIFPRSARNSGSDAVGEEEEEHPHSTSALETRESWRDSDDAAGRCRVQFQAACAPYPTRSGRHGGCYLNKKCT